MTQSRQSISATKRGKGRPAKGDNDVGRTRLIEATIHLLQTLPLAKATISRIAQQAGVDPALVRYYFGDRTQLLVAVVDHLRSDLTPFDRTADPQAALTQRIERALQPKPSAPLLHRLLAEELSENGNHETRRRARDITLELAAGYHDLFADPGPKALRPVDPVFLHLLVTAAADVYQSSVARLETDASNADGIGEARRFKDFFVDVVLNGLRPR